MRLAGLLFMKVPGWGDLPKQASVFCRALSGAVACLLFSHAVAYSQSTAAPVTTPSASAATSVVTLPKTIPFKQDSALASGESGPSLAAIAVVVAIGFLGFALWVWRNRRLAGGVDNTAKRSSWWGGASSRDVLLHGTTRLSPRHSVHDIEWRGRRLLIGCTDQSMTLLSERTMAESPEGAAAQGHPVSAQQEGAP